MYKFILLIWIWFSCFFYLQSHWIFFLRKSKITNQKSILISVCWDSSYWNWFVGVFHIEFRFVELFLNFFSYCVCLCRFEFGGLNYKSYFFWLILFGSIKIWKGELRGIKDKSKKNKLRVKQECSDKPLSVNMQGSVWSLLLTDFFLDLNVFQ
jgi:hypothetical protein